MIIFVLVIALLLRLINLNQSLWLDEAINVIFARSLTFKELVFNYSLGDFHPPLFHVLLKIWIISFGSSEIAVRSLSVILGTATVFTVYLIAKKLFESKTATISSLLMATSPLAVYYSQEARMYMLAAFTTSLSVYFFISILSRKTFLNLLGFIVFSSLMLYSDYLPYLMMPVYGLLLFINRRKMPKGVITSFIPALILIFILILPWLVIFPRQLNTGLSAAAASPAWAQVVGSSSLSSFLITFVKFTIGRISHDNNFVYALLFAPVAIYIIFLFTLSLFRVSGTRSFLYYWFFAPIILAFIISFFIPVFTYFRFIFVLPAFYLILSSAIVTLNSTKLVRLLLIPMLLVNLISTSIYYMNPKFHRENWRQATAFVHTQAKPRSVVLFESTYSLAPFDYYNKDKIKAYGALDSFSPDPSKVRQIVKENTKDTNQVFLFGYLAPITDPSGVLFQELTMQGFVNTETSDVTGVGFVYEFRR